MQSRPRKAHQLATKPRLVVDHSKGHGAHPKKRSDRSGTSALTTHVARDVHQAVKDLADSEHLTIDEAMHLAIALLLKRFDRAPVNALEVKLKQHRLQSYLPSES
jgi:hypothetical protein